MNGSPCINFRWGHALMLAAFLPTAGAAPWSSEVEALRRFRVRATETTFQFNAEAQSDQRIDRGERMRRDFVLFEPVVAVTFHGSIYHPNFFDFTFRPAFGPSWEEMRLSEDGTPSRSQKWVRNFDARCYVLREKPFATHLFAERNFSYRDVDFFNRARVDSLRYGGDSGYVRGSVPLKFEASHLTETVTGDVGRITEVTDNVFSISGSRMVREEHKTNFSYQLDRFDRQESGQRPAAGETHNASFFDQNLWGVDQWISLSSVGMISRLTTDNSRTQTLTLLESLALRLRSNLVGEGHYDFSLQHSDQVADRAHEVRLSLRHQLFQSLTSTVAVQGATMASRSAGTSVDHQRIGIAAEEHYTKRLPGNSSLSLSVNWRGDHQNRRTEGEVLRIANEPIVLNDRQPTLLSQPAVLEVGRVSNALGYSYYAGLDYTTVWHGTMVEIRRIPGGNIADGAQVLVSYSAAALPTDRYVTVTRGYNVRLDLFGGLIGVYGRLNRVDNFGGRSVVLRTAADRVSGAEFVWRWVSFGAERERMDSNLSPYSARRVFQTCAVDLGNGSMVSVNFDRSWTDFPDSGQKRKSYGWIARIQHQWTSALSWNVEAGVRRERGQGIDQDRNAVRTSLDYSFGKLVLNLSFDRDHEELIGESHQRTHAVVRIRRTF